MPAASGQVPSSIPRGGLVWTNTVNAYDVNGDGIASPLDALEIISYINRHVGDVSPPAQQISPPRFFDCNIDGLISPADVLFVVNTFNTTSPYSGEGERHRSQFVAVGSPTAWDLERVESRAASADAATSWVPPAEPLGPAPFPQTPSPSSRAADSPSSPELGEPPVEAPYLIDLEPLLEQITAGLGRSTTWLPDRS